MEIAGDQRLQGQSSSPIKANPGSDLESLVLNQPKFEGVDPESESRPLKEEVKPLDSNMTTEPIVASRVLNRFQNRVLEVAQRQNLVIAILRHLPECSFSRHRGHHHHASPRRPPSTQFQDLFVEIPKACRCGRQGRSMQTRCASKLGSWSYDKFGNIHKKIGEKSREIERLYKQSGTHGVMQTIHGLEKEVEGLHECDEVYWRQRSRVDWLVAGDRNSKFFHAKATARKKKNHILSLLDVEEVLGNGRE
ncbi:hypothetical protein Dsin_023852 [Dipteronia sinensis]|uniref:Uncharacterized protein n=1 Tax=Dipteronia sinensis TaxID=43782 RepID=A0AAE0A520_9ROSI|nr:hypothetical protein Dsin_023852 [Dipteronia sinensis]